MTYLPTTVNMQYHHQQSCGNDAFLQYNHQYRMQMAQQKQAILSTYMQLAQYNQYNAQCHAFTRNSSEDSCLSSSSSCFQPHTVPKPLPSPKKLVIFDWDDTLYPTTSWYIEKEKHLKWTVSQVHDYGKAVYNLLIQYIEKFGVENVYIITNGNAKWIHHSVDSIISKLKESNLCSIYWNQIKELLSTTLKHQTISARSLHEHEYPQQPTMWKTLVFKDVAMKHFGTNSKRECTIISIGEDSMDEFAASQETQKWMKSKYGFESVHRFKLQRASSKEVMRAQFKFLMELVQSKDFKWHSCDINVADYISMKQ